MSLKAFHIVFVTLATLLAAGFGAWCIQQHRDGGGARMLFAAGLSFGVTVVLIVYGVWFLRKLRHVSYL